MDIKTQLRVKGVCNPWNILQTSTRNLQYKKDHFPRLKWFSSCLAVAFAQSIEARCEVGDKDVVGAAPIGDAPTTSEWSTILLPTEVRIILEVWRYFFSFFMSETDEEISM